ncbi:biotin--[acetyl-CoA-carboxylase] ligase [Desulfoluna spongiiphila]|uniref:biotin--[acetyl-CoA-carboxylase] ligase n=1 Tax=Desulfoluna spongiiphila TaxID=419481 RepID=UPI001256F6CA|nr:biotin--[acetyl-CoA-carboxylase] ligase [Desulfoluna spongiiphila]VVS92906.1 bifunctional ligase/repressor bira [Desulfoluna spongiiphila]
MTLSGKRQDLLSAMRSRTGHWISGEELSGELGISRAAISKHIAAIKALGYAISSAPGKGYLLTEAPDLLLAQEILLGLDTSVMGKNGIVHHHLTDSTNTRARDLARDGAPEGTLVVAEAQSAGRGRKGRSWLARPGEGLLFSLVLRPDMEPSRAALITLMTAVSVAEALINETGIDARIKWPNDILVGGKKLAGILTEMSMELDAVDYVITGLGLNVNTPAEAFSPEITDIATSVMAESASAFSRVALLQAILSRFETHYQTLTTRGPESILSRWKELSDIVGRRVRVSMMREEIEGQVTDIDADGVLLVQTEAGDALRILSGDVTYLDPCER